MPYIGKTTDGFGIRERFTYLASAGATSISGADANGKTLLYEDPEYVDVFLNGIRLKKGTDYNTSTANTIAGLAALALNDEVEVIVQDVFTLADMVSANTGGDFRGNIAIQKDSGVLSLMYHRFNENKYPSTNIRMEIFQWALRRCWDAFQPRRR